MQRWMMWALMGVVVVALMVTGCESSSSDPGTADISCRNAVEGGHVVDVHIVPGAPGSSPSIFERTPDVAGLAHGDTPDGVSFDVGQYVVIFVVAGTEQVLARGYITLAAGGNVAATLTGDPSSPPTVVFTDN